MSSLTTIAAIALLQPAAEGPVEDERPVRSERRVPEQEQRAADWGRERRRLQLHTGLSGAFAGVMVLTGTLLMVAPDGCDNDNCELNFGRFFTGVALVPLATIPIATGIYWGVRLHRHDHQRPTTVLRPGAGGFVLHF